MDIEVVADRERYEGAWRGAGGCFTQSWGWGEVKRPAYEPLRVLVRETPIQVLVRSLPVIGGRFGYAPRAFSSSTLPSPADLAAISRQICHDHTLTHLIYEPDIWQEACDEPSWHSAGFKTNERTIQPHYSRWLDLTSPEDELFARLAKDVRRRAKRAEEAGVRFVEDTGQEGLEKFYQTLHGVSQRAGFDIHPREYYQHIFDEFSREGTAHIYFALDRDTILYTLFALQDNGVFRRLYGGPSLEGRSSDGAQFVGWQAILAARQLGCESMDFWGVAHPDDTKNPLAGVSRFKATLGGELITYWPQLIWVADAPRYRLYQSLLHGKKLAGKAKRFIRTKN